jgi:hypothetical protein
MASNAVTSELRSDAHLCTEFWLGVAETFNRPLADYELAALPGLGDLGVIDAYFSFLNDAERSEVLWALREFMRAR